ncbi:RNA polymerase sigma factor [Rhodopirellula sp. MGV]|uniref:RNA polymerase sigma factor n=1 Tax=Rhodopirellula sp. MGV TaxID=2023130 RepID=UPI000B968F71|nr:sigma factor [Rhodopirellula sp. MGV]OYP36077.1 hypothetical protein CGZ80_10045 [Rhodopirellula sp. MGV]PNY36565.1 hypothetical protein C2E31_11965 [Rhodopirellula baltica]
MTSDNSKVDTDRLSQIRTHWSAVVGTTPAEECGSTEIQRELLLRYAGPAYRYLLAMVRDPDVADDLSQEFAFRFIRGDFQKASPERGRFRDYLKRALINLANDHFRRLKKSPIVASVHSPHSQEPSYASKIEAMFDEDWRRELLCRTWTAMDAADVTSQTCYSVILKLRTQHPTHNSKSLAILAGEQLEREVTAAWLRQNLKRARDRFCELMRVEVQNTLLFAGTEEVESELQLLGLQKYSRV